MTRREKEEEEEEEEKRQLIKLDIDIWGSNDTSSFKMEKNELFNIISPV
jgi:hypothetical protein